MGKSGCQRLGDHRTGEQLRPGGRGLAHSSLGPPGLGRFWKPSTEVTRTQFSGGARWGSPRGESSRHKDGSHARRSPNVTWASAGSQRCRRGQGGSVGTGCWEASCPPLRPALALSTAVPPRLYLHLENSVWPRDRGASRPSCRPPGSPRLGPGSPSLPVELLHFSLLQAVDTRPPELDRADNGRRDWSGPPDLSLRQQS